MEGFRTLLIAEKLLSTDEVDKLRSRITEAEADIKNRRASLKNIFDDIETNLDLLGCTVLEDKL